MRRRVEKSGGEEGIQVFKTKQVSLFVCMCILQSKRQINIQRK